MVAFIAYCVLTWMYINISYLIQGTVLLQEGDKLYPSGHLHGNLQGPDPLLDTARCRVAGGELRLHSRQLIQLHVLPVDEDVTSIKTNILFLRKLKAVMPALGYTVLAQMSPCFSLSPSISALSK